jgi:hypothetical protein
MGSGSWFAQAERQAWKRFLLALALFGLLLAAWPLCAWAYRPLFRAGGQFLLGVVAPLEDVRVRFVPGSGGAIARDTVRMDTLILLEHRTLRGPPAQIPASAFFHAYQPTAILLALFLGATSLPWKARRRALLLALVVLHVFIGLRLVVPVLYAYTGQNVDGRPLVELSPLALRCLYWTKHFVWVEPAMTYLVPVTLWAACVFRRRPIAPPELA